MQLQWLCAEYGMKGIKDFDGRGTTNQPLE